MSPVTFLLFQSGTHIAERIPKETIESWDRNRGSVMALLVRIETFSPITLSAMLRLKVISSLRDLGLSEFVRTDLTSRPLSSPLVNMRAPRSGLTTLKASSRMKSRSSLHGRSLIRAMLAWLRADRIWFCLMMAAESSALGPVFDFLDALARLSHVSSDLRA